MWSGRCHLAPWTLDDIMTSETCHHQPSSLTSLLSTQVREKQTESPEFTNKFHHHQGSFSLTRRHRVTSPDQREICPWADIGQVWQLASLGSQWSLGWSSDAMECAPCPITLAHWWTLHPAPGAPHKWSLLAGREHKCLFDAYCICLEITIGEMHTNTICI